MVPVLTHAQSRARIAYLRRQGCKVREVRQGNSIYVFKSCPKSNPEEDPNQLSAPTKAALWIGSIATIITGTGVLLSFLWPLPTERLYYRGVIFSIDRSAGTWTGSFSYGSNDFAVNGSSRDDIIARTQWQIDGILGGVAPKPAAVAGFTR